MIFSDLLTVILPSLCLLLYLFLSNPINENSFSSNLAYKSLYPSGFLYISFTLPPVTISISTFIASTVTPCHVLIGEDFYLTALTERKDVTFGSLGLSYFTHYDLFSSYPFNCTSRNVIFLYS